MAERPARRIFVGDVQGCAAQLRRLLDRVGFDAAADRLVCAGDLVNRGPDSAGVLRLLMEVAAESVLGNHDVHLLDVAAGRAPGRRGDTFGDVLVADDRQALLDWLRDRPMLVHDGDVVVVHAGVRPGWPSLATMDEELRRRFAALAGRGRSPFEDEEVRFALTARFCTADGRLPPDDREPPGAPYRNWADWYRGLETVVFGHFARQGLLVRPNLRGLDTGCVYGGRLTAWIAEEDRIVSVGCRE